MKPPGWPESEICEKKGFARHGRARLKSQDRRPRQEDCPDLEASLGYIVILKKQEDATSEKR